MTEYNVGLTTKEMRTIIYALDKRFADKRMFAADRGESVRSIAERIRAIHDSSAYESEINTLKESVRFLFEDSFNYIRKDKE